MSPLTAVGAKVLMVGWPSDLAAEIVQAVYR